MAGTTNAFKRIDKKIADLHDWSRASGSFMSFAIRTSLGA